jgi:Zn-dependent metalloprotease
MKISILNMDCRNSLQRMRLSWRVCNYSILALALIFIQLLISCSSNKPESIPTASKPIESKPAENMPEYTNNQDIPEKYTSNNPMEDQAERPMSTHYVPRYAQYAYAYLEQEKAKYNLEDPRAQLTFIGENIDKQQNKHIKFQQIHHGVPVWGYQMIVHIDANDRVYSVTGDILTGLGNLNPNPSIPEQRVNTEIEQHEDWGKQGWKVANSDLYVFNHNSINYLTYRLTLVKGLLREFLFVNANSGDVIHRVSGTPTATRF